MNETEETSKVLVKCESDVNHDHIVKVMSASDFFADTFESAKSCFGGIVNFFNPSQTFEEAEQDQMRLDVNAAICKQTEVLRNTSSAMQTQLTDLDAEIEQYKAELRAKGITPQKPDSQRMVEPGQQEMSIALSSKLAESIYIPEKSSTRELNVIRSEIEESTVQLENLFGSFLEQTARNQQSIKDHKVSNAENQVVYVHHF